MSETTSTYGKTGSVALVAAAVALGGATVMGESGTAPETLTQGIGYLGLALLAAGMIALVLLLVDIYSTDEN